ncbi:hypothetical protein IWQ60_008666 [Tieghemiomyces parasiticus]|uniref:RING-type E3 ubiquitin transferase n=1 Tax=Tieghemiomyces parasiticus TaxID=78921 RepID=A0A9W7ZWW2_9FUNG|nr:hypothetical protein IWQ60_008666 [Tieghemiomyces parasiticus]
MSTGYLRILVVFLVYLCSLAAGVDVTLNIDALLLNSNVAVFQNLTSANLLNNTNTTSYNLITSSSNVNTGVLFNFRGSANPQPFTNLSNIAVVNMNEIQVTLSYLSVMSTMNVALILAYNGDDSAMMSVSQIRMSPVIALDPSAGSALQELIDQTASPANNETKPALPSPYGQVLDQFDAADAQDTYHHRLYARLSFANNGSKLVEGGGGGSTIGTAIGLGCFGGILALLILWVCYRLRRRRRIVEQERRERRERGIDSLADILRGVKVAPLDPDHLPYLRKIRLTKENIVTLGLQNAISTIRSLRDLSILSVTRPERSYGSRRGSRGTSSTVEEISNRSSRSDGGKKQPKGSQDSCDSMGSDISDGIKSVNPYGYDENHRELSIPALMSHVTDSMRSIGSTGAGCTTDKGRPSCTICLDRFRSGHYVRRLPCKHVFHRRCVDTWLLTKSAVCPLCKFDCSHYCSVKVMFNKDRVDMSISNISDSDTKIDVSMP